MPIASQSIQTSGLMQGDIVQILMERKENNYLVPRFVE
jgi:hypothetical protein